jgi:thioredoxin reductase
MSCHKLAAGSAIYACLDCHVNSHAPWYKNSGSSVPRENLAKVSCRLIEAETYQDKNLLVVGGGDSAIEAALALSRSGTNKVALSYRGDAFQRAKDRNRQFLASATSEGRIQQLLKSEVQEIRPDSVTLTSNANKVDLPNDYTFVLIGGESPEDFLRKTGIEIVEKVLSA